VPPSPDATFASCGCSIPEAGLAGAGAGAATGAGAIFFRAAGFFAAIFLAAFFAGLGALAFLVDFFAAAFTDFLAAPLAPPFFAEALAAGAFFADFFAAFFAGALVPLLLEPFDFLLDFFAGILRFSLLAERSLGLPERADNLPTFASDVYR
jgi:hypothetical protein